MSVLQFLIHPQYGCCTTGELMALNRMDKDGYKKLTDWAREEMTNRGIPIDVPAAK
jgi:hypothetical protein